MANEYGDSSGWDEALETDQRAGRKTSGKKWSSFHKFSNVNTLIHLAKPEKPYMHPVHGTPLPFRVGEQHFIPFGGKKKNGTSIECGAKWNEPCIVHAYVNPQAYGLTNTPPNPGLDPQGAKPYYAVGMWIEEWYHLADYYIDEHNPAKGTFKRREKCSGKGCELCQENVMRVFGNKNWFSISPGQWKHSFHALNKYIENHFCHCGGNIFVTSFFCKGCHQTIVDVSESCDFCKEGGVELHMDTGMAVCPRCHRDWPADYDKHEKIVDLVGERFKCSCGANEYPVPKRMCSNESCAVDPYGIFDCQLSVHTTGDQKEKRIVIGEYKLQEPDPRLFDPQFQGADVMAVKIAENMKKPLDLNYLLRPMSPDEQAKELHLPNPFAISGRAAGYSNYPRGVTDQPAADTAPVEGDVEYPQ